MHIMVVHQYHLHKDDPGGSRWNQFVKYWSQAGHKVTVLAGTVHYATGKKRLEYKGKFIVREKVMDNLDVLWCHVSEAYNKSFIGRAWAYVSFVASSVLAGLFCAGKCDVIICTSPPLTIGLTGWILSKLKRIPMVFEVRDLWPESAIDTGVLTNKWLIKLSYWLERKSYSSSKWINVLTPAFEDTLISQKGIPPEKISMIPNAADLDIIKPGPRDNWVREKHKLKNKFVITYVGAHGVANHLLQLLEVAKRLKEHPEIVLMLVGDGMEKPKLIEAARASNLDNVTFVAPVPKSQIVDYINASDVCTAVLKKCDTFKTVYPNKVFDYMAAAKPVIIGVDGAARKLVEDAGAGIFAEPENAQSFAEAAMFLKKNPKKQRAFGENGRKFVQEHFSRQELSDKYLKIIEKFNTREKTK